MESMPAVSSSARLTVKRGTMGISEVRREEGRVLSQTIHELLPGVIEAGTGFAFELVLRIKLALEANCCLSHRLTGGCYFSHLVTWKHNLREG